MNIKHRSIFSPEGIKTIEERYNAKYLLDTAVLGSRDDDDTPNWSLTRGAVFWQEEAYPETGSHYFAMYLNPLDGKVFITDGSWIEEQTFIAAQTEDGLDFSRDRHDYLSIPGLGMLDGGRDYLRTNIPDDMLVRFKIKDGEVCTF